MDDRRDDRAGQPYNARMGDIDRTKYRLAAAGRTESPKNYGDELAADKEQGAGRPPAYPCGRLGQTGGQPRDGVPDIVSGCSGAAVRLLATATHML